MTWAWVGLCLSCAAGWGAWTMSCGVACMQGRRHMEQSWLLLARIPQQPPRLVGIWVGALPGPWSVDRLHKGAATPVIPTARSTIHRASKHPITRSNISIRGSDEEPSRPLARQREAARVGERTPGCLPAGMMLGVLGASRLRACPHAGPRPRSIAKEKGPMGLGSMLTPPRCPPIHHRRHGPTKPTSHAIKRGGRGGGDREARNTPKQAKAGQGHDQERGAAHSMAAEERQWQYLTPAGDKRVRPSDA